MYYFEYIFSNGSNQSVLRRNTTIILPQIMLSGYLFLVIDPNLELDVFWANEHIRLVSIERGTNAENMINMNESSSNAAKVLDSLHWHPVEQRICFNSL